MPTVKQLKLIANAGEPDSVLSRRIDVVAAAVAWHDCLCRFYRSSKTADMCEVDDAEDHLELAIRRYKSALKRRVK